MRLSLIVAMDSMAFIGKDNKIPWHLSEDLKRFKKLTMGHTLIMGRTTFESIGKPLPGRRTIVCTRGSWTAPGVEVAHSISDAVKLCETEEEVFVAGGAQVYEFTHNRAHRMYLTRIEHFFGGDILFPVFGGTAWKVTSTEEHLPSEVFPYAYRYEQWDRLGWGQGESIDIPFEQTEWSKTVLDANAHLSEYIQQGNRPPWDLRKP